MNNPAVIRRFDRALIRSRRGFSGRVDMVFDHAAVACPDKRGPRLTLLHGSRGLVPLGLALDRGNFRRLEAAAVRVEGRQVTIAERSGSVEVFCLEGEGVALDLDSGQTGGRRDLLSAQFGRLDLPDRARALALAASCDRASETCGPGVEQRILERAAGHAGRIAGALAEGRAHPASFRAPVRGLVGLGPGLTPTGDDVLLGLSAAALRFRGAGWIGKTSVDAFLRCFEELDGSSTTVTSVEMLRHAARGAFPERLVGFVRVLGRDDPDGGIRAKARALMQTGGWSGCDMLSGVAVLAARVLERSPTSNVGWD